jgi:hypothetical protein
MVRDKLDKRQGIAFALLLACAIASQAGAQDLPRDFEIPLPLFAAQSAWNQVASAAEVTDDSDQRILVFYRVLRGDQSTMDVLDPDPVNWPFMDINYDDFSIPIGRMGTELASIPIVEYEGATGGNNAKLPADPSGAVDLPAPVGLVRPAGPQNTGADGHLVLYRPDRYLAYDYWQATTATDSEGNSLGGGQLGPIILAAGTVDLFTVHGPGTNPRGMYSARASGVPLLAGLILPEDVESGSIDHALAFALPGMRNTAPNTDDPIPEDIFYPAATTETTYINRHPLSLAGGERIRLKPSLVNESGAPLDETVLAPITRMFLAALRDYGAYVVDNGGGFSFYAEDVHTAKVDLSDQQVNELIGAPVGSALPAGTNKWQILMETLNLELESIPLAYGPWEDGQDPTTATVSVSNFEVIEPARIPSETIAVSVSSARTTFLPGDNLTVSVYVNNPSGSSIADFFFGLVGPDGITATLFTDPQFNSIEVSLQNFSNWLPVVGNIDLRVPFVYNEPDFYTHTWDASNQAGRYVLFVAATARGALQDGRLDTGDLLALDTIALTFSP